jgi:hypothetical protein
LTNPNVPVVVSPDSSGTQAIELAGTAVPSSIRR